MALLGYIALAAMGTLGLVGAGGSILTIPILVYLLKSQVLLATSYSLVVVGSTAFIGLLRYCYHILNTIYLGSIHSTLFYDSSFAPYYRVSFH